MKEMSRRRDNILWLAKTLKDIENIRQTKLDVDVLLESGEYSECLEAIEECERSLRAAIETATKNGRGGEVGEEKGSIMPSTTHKNSYNSNNAATKTSTTKNVFSCFSHLPKDLEIAKRKCTGAITAELCSRARVESNVVDDEIATIVKKVSTIASKTTKGILRRASTIGCRNPSYRRFVACCDRARSCQQLTPFTQSREKSCAI